MQSKIRDYGTSPSVRVLYSMVSATTGGVSIDASAMPGTPGYPDQITCSLTSNDSMAARDLIKIDIQRETADAADTAAGDMGIVGVVLEYAKR